MKGVLMLNTWAGVRRYPVEILSETPKKYRVRLKERTPLAGRNRWGRVGQVVTVPRYAVKVEAD